MDLQKLDELWRNAQRAKPHLDTSVIKFLNEYERQRFPPKKKGIVLSVQIGVPPRPVYEEELQELHANLYANRGVIPNGKLPLIYAIIEEAINSCAEMD